MASASSEESIKVLRKIFATHGIPELMVSDTGTSFTSGEVDAFCRRNGGESHSSGPVSPIIEWPSGMVYPHFQGDTEGNKRMNSGKIGSSAVPLLYNHSFKHRHNSNREVDEYEAPNSHGFAEAQPKDSSS